MADTRLRSNPSQARAQETFRHILVTSAELLEEVGWDGFNTNLLAERAGVRVAALYRYFPNKLAVVSALAENLVEEWDDWMRGFDTRLDAGEGIREAWAYYVLRFPKLLKSRPGGMAVRRAMQASPTLREIDQKDSRRLSERLANSLDRTMPHLGKKMSFTAASVLMESVTAVLDRALEAKPAEARRLIGEMLVMQNAYFDHLESRGPSKEA